MVRGRLARLRRTSETIPRQSPRAGRCGAGGRADASARPPPRWPPSSGVWRGCVAHPRRSRARGAQGGQGGPGGRAVRPGRAPDRQAREGAGGRRKPTAAPPPFALVAHTSPPWRSTIWRTMARPRPEPGRGPGGRGAVEPPEHVGLVDRVDAVAVVADLEARAVDRYVDGRPRWAVLHRVVDQVGHGPLHHPGADGDVGVPGVRDADRPPGAALGAGGHRLGQLGQVDHLRLLVGRRTVGGQLDQLVDEVGQLAALDLDVAQHDLPLLDRQVGGPLQVLDVGAQRGERRPQLVAGVGDEALLLIAGRGERGDHGAQALGQAADLARAVRRQRRRQVVRGRDVLGRVTEPAHRAHDAPGQEPSQSGRADHTGEGEQDQPQLQPVQRGLRLRQVPGDLERRAVPPRLGQLAVPDAVDGGRAQQGFGVGVRRDGEVTTVDGQPRTRVDALGEATVGGDDLRRRRRLQRTDGRAAQERATGPAVVAVAAHQGGGARHQRLVDRRRQLADRRHVGAHTGERADQRGDQGQAEGDAPTEAHGILST